MQVSLVGNGLPQALHVGARSIQAQDPGCDGLAVKRGGLRLVVRHVPVRLEAGGAMPVVPHVADMAKPLVEGR